MFQEEGIQAYEWRSHEKPWWWLSGEGERVWEMKEKKEDLVV